MALVLPPSMDLPMDKEINKTLVCKPCNSTLVDEIMCVACDNKCPKHKVIKYHASKYDMTDNIVQTTLCGAVNQLDNICIDCDRKLIATNTCTCCHQKFNLYRVISFDEGNYDFGDYIVSRALSLHHRLVHGSTEYICKICDKNLRSNETHLPKMPRKAGARKIFTSHT